MPNLSRNLLSNWWQAKWRGTQSHRTTSSTSPKVNLCFNWTDKTKSGIDLCPVNIAATAKALQSTQGFHKHISERKLEIIFKQLED